MIEYLNKKKKIDMQKKTDQITLFNIDEDNAQVDGGFIRAGCRLIAKRTPDCQDKTQAIELTYIPKQTVDRNRSSAKQRWEQRKQADRNGTNAQQPMSDAKEDIIEEDVDEDDDKDKDIIEEMKADEPKEPQKIKFKSCKLE